MKKKKIVGNDKIIGRPIRLNQQTLTPKTGEEYAEVMWIGDCHYGSPQFDEPRFIKMLDFCLKNKVYVFLMGDLIEMATRNSVGAGVYEQSNNGQSQYEQMVSWLRPLAEAKLLVGFHQGNHEERVYKDTGVNISKMMARELHIPYLGDACWSRFKVGTQSYSIYSLHGRSGARFDGTSLLALERISTSFFCDLICMGHAHKMISSTVIIQVIDLKTKTVKEHKKTLVITGSYLKYDNSYASAVGLPISKLGSPKAKFYATRKDIVISW